MMIEPTETESKETMDAFIDAMIDLAKVAETNPEKLKAAPLTSPVGRLDETAAARNPNLAHLAYSSLRASEATTICRFA